jgi:hypothetical protein
MSVGDNAIWFCSWRVSSLCSSVSRHSFSTSKFPRSSTSCERPCLLLIEVLPSPNRAGNTSGGLGGRHAPQNSWADTSPTKSFCRSLFLRGTAGEPTLALILPIRPHQALVGGLRLAVCCATVSTITRSMTAIPSRSFAPNSKRENHVVLLSVYSSLAEVFRKYPASCQTSCTDSLIVELSGTIRLLRQTPSGRQKSKVTTKGFTLQRYTHNLTRRKRRNDKTYWRAKYPSTGFLFKQISRPLC